MKHIQTEMRLLREMRREDEGRMMRLEEELQKHRYEEQSRYQAVEERFVRFDQSLPVKFSEISKEIERSQEMVLLFPHTNTCFFCHLCPKKEPTSLSFLFFSFSI